MTLAKERPQDNRFVTYTDWPGYLKFLEATAERANVYITYDRGFLEIVTTSIEHEWMKTVLARLLERSAFHLGLPLTAAGHMTFQRQDLGRGLEADECYWLTDVEAITNEYDPRHDPPPDLVIEIDITKRSSRRMKIYGAMGVGEVWRYARRSGLRVFERTSAGTYEQRVFSPRFPKMPLAEPRKHLDMAYQTRNLMAILRSWDEYLAKQVPPKP